MGCLVARVQSLLTDVNRIVNEGSVIDPASVTLCSPTQSTFDDANLPEKRIVASLGSRDCAGKSSLI